MCICWHISSIIGHSAGFIGSPVHLYRVLYWCRIPWCGILVLPNLIDAEFKFTKFLVMPNMYVTESSGHLLGLRLRWNGGNRNSQPSKFVGRQSLRTWYKESERIFVILYSPKQFPKVQTNTWRLPLLWYPGLSMFSNFAKLNFKVVWYW